MGRAIKLLATSKKENDSYAVMVAPFLLPKTHPLYSVDGVFNAIFVKGNVLGDAMFYGSGAGKLPTASAVVADVVEMAKHMHTNIPVEWRPEKKELVDYKNTKTKFFVRTKASEEKVKEVFEAVEFVKAEGISGELGFVTETMTEAEFEEKKAALADVIQRIRMTD